MTCGSYDLSKGSKKLESRSAAINTGTEEVPRSWRDLGNERLDCGFH